MKKFKTMMAMMLALVSMCVAFSSCSSARSNDDRSHDSILSKRCNKRCL